MPFDGQDAEAVKVLGQRQVDYYCSFAHWCYSGVVSADHPGPQPDRKDGSCFAWKESGDD
jgi:hypothetical protein